MSTAVDPSAEHHQTMQCMEIWGGNQLVDTSVTMPGLDAWVYSKPYGQSAATESGGGDVHYVSSCATGRITRLLVADVSGHGEQVCDVAGGLRSLMRRYINFIDQGEFIRSMNRKFVEVSAANCFATAVVTTFFAPTNTLALCNAGHPPPLLYRASTGKWTYLELAAGAERDSERGDEAGIANIPLGVLDMTEYEQFEVDLSPGDLVLCYTDSLIESKDSSGEMFGQEGLLNVVRTLGVAQVTSMIPSLLSTIAAQHPKNLTDDDVTVLLFRPSGAGTPPPLRDKLLAPVRVARGVLSSLRPGGGPTPMPELSLRCIGGALLDSLNHRRDAKPELPAPTKADH